VGSPLTTARVVGAHVASQPDSVGDAQVTTEEFAVLVRVERYGSDVTEDPQTGSVPSARASATPPSAAARAGRSPAQSSTIASADMRWMD
jgi:hypothetical protein